jgi:hypothetical protein
MQASWAFQKGKFKMQNSRAAAEFRQSTIGNLRSAIGNRKSSINNRQSAIENPKLKITINQSQI